VAPKKTAQKPPSAKARTLLFCGSDEGRAKEAAVEAVSSHTPEGADDFANEIIDGTAESAEHARRICHETAGALQTLPFFGGTKVVWLKGANFFDDSVIGRSQAAEEGRLLLQGLVEKGLPDDVIFVINATEVDKRRSFYKSLTKHATVTLFDRPDPGRDGWEAEMRRYVLDLAKARSATFTPEAIERFVLTAGTDSRLVASELEKLLLYVGDLSRPVEEDDVAAACSATREGVIFEVGLALARRDLPAALSRLDDLFARGENPVGILLAAIVPQVRSLLYARHLIDRHKLPPQRSLRDLEAALRHIPKAETAWLPAKKDGSPSLYPTFLAMRFATTFSEQQLRRGLQECLRANRRLVTTQLDPRVVLEQLLIRILAGREARPQKPARPARPAAAR